MVDTPSDIYSKELADDIAKKEKEYAAIEARQKELRTEIENDPTYKEISKALGSAHHERWSILETRREGISKKIRGYFTTDGNYPSYVRSSQYGTGRETNVLPIVLMAIKKHLGALSKMAGGDIEEIVRKLIDAERNSNKELMEIETRIRELATLEDNLRVRLNNFPQEMEITGLGTARYHLGNEIIKLKEIQFNPSRVKARIERERIRRLIQDNETIAKILAEIKEDMKG